MYTFVVLPLVRSVWLGFLFARNRHIGNKHVGRAECGKSRLNSALYNVSEGGDILQKLKEIARNGKGFYRLADFTLSNHKSRGFKREIARNGISSRVKSLDFSDVNSVTRKRERNGWVALEAKLTK